MTPAAMQTKKRTEVKLSKDPRLGFWPGIEAVFKKSNYLPQLEKFKYQFLAV